MPVITATPLVVAGLELVAPGIVSVAEWRAEDAPQPRPSAETTGVYGAVARIPGPQ
jgi:hypothetical protein